MSFRLDILPAAEEDIRQAAEWYEAREPGLSRRFAAEVYRAIRSLSRTALIHRVRLKRKQVRWIYAGHFPYRIIYYVEGDAVRVFAVLHAARHDRAWRQRI